VILGQGRNGLVFGHELGSSLCEWVPMARSYARLGYRALVFDFRGYNRLDDDVVAAVAELRRRGVTRSCWSARRWAARPCSGPPPGSDPRLPVKAAMVPLPPDQRDRQTRLEQQIQAASCTAAVPSLTSIGRRHPV